MKQYFFLSLFLLSFQFGFAQKHGIKMNFGYANFINDYQHDMVYGNSQKPDGLTFGLGYVYKFNRRIKFETIFLTMPEKENTRIVYFTPGGARSGNSFNSGFLIRQGCDYIFYQSKNGSFSFGGGALFSYSNLKNRYDANSGTSSNFNEKLNTQSLSLGMCTKSTFWVAEFCFIDLAITFDWINLSWKNHSSSLPIDPNYLPTLKNGFEATKRASIEIGVGFLF